MLTEEFNRDYVYERKEGYSCRNCMRELDYNSNSFKCNCRNEYDDY